MHPGPTEMSPSPRIFPQPLLGGQTILVLVHMVAPPFSLPFPWSYNRGFAALCFRFYFGGSAGSLGSGWEVRKWRHEEGGWQRRLEKCRGDSEVFVDRGQESDEERRDGECGGVKGPGSRRGNRTGGIGGGGEAP